jgi:hypothetical protein
MSTRSSFALTALSIVLLAAPARAQNFQNGSAETIWPGNVRLTASPVHMWGTEGRPDRTGGAFRLGYGFTEWFDVEAKTGFFDGVSLVGADGKFNLLGDETSLSVSVGGHRAYMAHGPDSNALDLAVQLGQRLGGRLEIFGGPAFSYESTSGVPDSGFTRWYLVPGFRLGVADRLDLVVEGGIGFNDDSPDFVTAGLALHVPVSSEARGRRRQ